DGTFAWMVRTPGRCCIAPTESGSLGFVTFVSPVYTNFTVMLGDSSLANYGNHVVYGQITSSGAMDWFNISPNPMPFVNSLTSIQGCAYNDGHFYMYGYYNGTFDFGNYPYAINNYCAINLGSYDLNEFIADVDWSQHTVINVVQTKYMQIKAMTFDENNNIFFGMQRKGTCSYYPESASFAGASIPQFSGDCYIFKTDPQFNLLNYHNLGGLEVQGIAQLYLTDIEYVNNNLYLALQNLEDNNHPLYLENDTVDVAYPAHIHIMSLSNNLDYRYCNTFEDSNYNDPLPLVFGGTSTSLNVLTIMGNIGQTSPSNWFINEFITNANVIRGRAYRDLNGNNIYDTTDLALSGVPVKINPMPYQLVTDSSGQYEAYVSLGTYTMTIPYLPMYYHNDPVPAQVTFVNNNQIDTVDVRALPDPGISDIEVEFFASEQLLFAQSCKHHIIVKNVGTTTEDVTITLTPLGFPFAPSPIGDITQMNLINGNYIYIINNMSPGQVKYFEVSYNPPISYLNMHGQQRLTTVSATINNTDVTPWNNNGAFSQELKAAYDPNIKLVQEAPLLDYYDLSNIHDFHYTIHFQNEGNYPATNIHIKDLIENDLNINSLEIISSSDPVRAKILDKTIHFYFDSIMLPAKADDEIGSRGYVHFKLNRNNNIQINDSIINNASIYFDYNPAIITNDAINIFIENLGLNEHQLTQLANIYPNPTKDKLFINSTTSEPLDLEVISITGQVMSSFKIQNSMTLDIESYPNGIYFIKINGAGTINTFKVVKY
ncbi:MAG: T9SS type A sorting domain-containing protein, partial [Crocinitomicaceae bacterium]